jgi:hypothetical protein
VLRGEGILGKYASVADMSRRILVQLINQVVRELCAKAKKKNDQE